MGTSRIRVYVAGAYSASDILTMLDNMRLGIALSLQTLQAGYAPFAPWLDFQYKLLGQVSLEDYYDMSMAWLEAADVVLVQPVRAETSVGTQAELTRAAELGIPIVHSLAELQERFPCAS